MKLRLHIPNGGGAVFGHRWGIHACWLDKDCQSVPTPAHTYITLAGYTWRINPLISRYYIRADGDNELHFGWGIEWHMLQYIGRKKRDVERPSAEG